VYKRVLVPLDGSALAEGILPFVLQVAGPLDLEIELLRVVRPVPPSVTELSRDVVVEDVEARLEECRAYLEAVARDLVDRGVRVRVHARRGEPAAEIVRAARELGADLIAMTTHGRSGLGRLLHGSVAAAVLRDAHVPVLLLRASEAEARARTARGVATEAVDPSAQPVRVRDLMTPDPITVPPETPVPEARRLMERHRIRHLLVTRGDRLVGIVTDRDIRLNLPSPATSLSVWEVNYLLAKLTVEQVMTRSVITIAPEREARAAAALMLEHRIGALPVVDGGRLLGILTETDILRAFTRQGEPARAGG